MLVYKCKPSDSSFTDPGNVVDPLHAKLEEWSPCGIFLNILVDICRISNQIRAIRCVYCIFLIRIYGFIKMSLALRHYENQHLFEDNDISFVTIDHTWDNGQSKRRTSLGQMKRYKIGQVLLLLEFNLESLTINILLKQVRYNIILPRSLKVHIPISISHQTDC